MIYGDTIIKTMIESGRIKNIYEGALNPASINIRLGNTFLVPVRDQIIRLGEEIEYETFRINEKEIMWIEPGDFVLATTKEWFDIPITASAFVQGRSSIGRAGLTIQNAGFVDPGFRGHITLELKNETDMKIGLVPGYPVGQLIFMETYDASRGYQGKYLDQVDATGSKMQDDIYKPDKQVEVKIDV